GGLGCSGGGRRHRDRGGVDVEKPEGPRRVVAGAVGVVGPGGVELAAIKVQAGVVAVVLVDPGPGGVGARGAGADLHVRHETQPAVGADRGPELRFVVGDAVGVARAAGAEVVAAVVPADP